MLSPATEGLGWCEHTLRGWEGEEGERGGAERCPCRRKVRSFEI